jgi:serine/threonine protein kinase/Tfp pilus assembly protein PilF
MSSPMAHHALGHDVVIGQTLGHYRIIEKIGAGGMGEVYCARDEHLDREVAIKVLPPGTLSDEASRKRFHKEAIALSRLNHPNIATIHDFDTQQGVDFLVLEFIPGITLSEKLANRPLPEKEVVALGTQLADGLTVAHEHGVVHRDLKPGNLRVTSDGRLKILDFGLAKLRRPITESAATESFSETQAMAGTLPYMAPEQLLGQEIDARTDIHAAGAVLYEMATGRRPFEAADSQLISAILRKLPVRPTALNTELSAELERIIGKCLEKEPEHRYQSAKELAVDLRRVARDKYSGHISLKAPPIPHVRRAVKHEKVLATAAGMLILLLLLLVAGLRLMRTKELSERAGIPPSIAVLPFTDLSPGKDQEYFSDGLAEELLNSLAKIQGLHVAARTSAFQFKGKNEDLRVIGQKLNVATVLEGSVRKQGTRVRITAQLIQVSDGFHLWSEAYDRNLTDIFAVQEDIANAVAGSLRVTLLGERAPSSRGTNIEAYNAYLQGKYFFARYDQEDVDKAISCYEQAVRLDPNYALAWASLAEARSFRATSYGPIDGFRMARQAAERALALDANLAEAHAMMGWIKREYEWDWAGAGTSFQRALALAPGNAMTIRETANLAATLGNFEQALILGRRAVELDPLNGRAYEGLVFHLYYSGRLDDAAEAAKKALDLNLDVPTLHTLLSWVYLAQSRPQEALAEARRETDPGFHQQGLALAYYALGNKKESDTELTESIAQFQAEGAFQIAEVYAYRGETDRAFEWLNRAYAQHDSGFSIMKGDPLLKNLEPDPRYNALLRRLHLPV